jgi:hypothetical protein
VTLARAHGVRQDRAREERDVKTDLKSEIAAYTARRGTFSIVEVPPMQHLAIDGRGDPNTSPACRDALAALYPLAYAVKFLSSTRLDQDYVVMPLEALWWSRARSWPRGSDPGRTTGRVRGRRC